MKKKLNQIKLLLLDVDGVLTDGKITYTDSGEEIKNFSVKDGLGIRLLIDSGVKVGIITGRSSNALFKRCENLGINKNMVFHGIKDKVKALETIFNNTGISYENMAFVGDDLPDIPVMKKVGVSFAVANASLDLIKMADYTTANKGGDGAVREICENILKATNLWDSVLSRFIK